jgi:DUF971 family protein
MRARQLIAYPGRRSVISCRQGHDFGRLTVMTSPTGAPDLTPQAITLAADRRRLLIDWGGGRQDAASATALWDACRSSRSVRLRVDGWAVPARDDITIVDVRPVGHYAVNLVFSDGHDRGIYPWRYLKEIASKESAAAGN